MLAAPVAMAAVGGSAVGLGAFTWLRWAVAALVAGMVVDCVHHARDEGAAARERRRLVLDDLELVDRADQLRP